MPFCESIALLATEIESQLEDINSAESKRLLALKNMPKHYKAMHLEQFDSEFKDAYMVSETQTRKSYKAIDILAELAYENLYVEFSDKDTMSTYNWVVKELANLNIVVSSKLNMSGW